MKQNANEGLKTKRVLRAQKLGVTYEVATKNAVLVDENNQVVPQEEAEMILRSYCAQKVSVPRFEENLKDRAEEMAKEIAENSEQLIITSEPKQEQINRINAMLTRKALTLLPMVPDMFKFDGKEYRYKVTRDSNISDKVYVPAGAATTNTATQMKGRNPYSYYSKEVTSKAAEMLRQVLKPQITISEDGYVTLYIMGQVKVRYQKATYASQPSAGEVCYGFVKESTK